MRQGDAHSAPKPLWARTEFVAFEEDSPPQSRKGGGVCTAAAFGVFCLRGTVAAFSVDPCGKLQKLSRPPFSAERSPKSARRLRVPWSFAAGWGQGGCLRVPLLRGLRSVGKDGVCRGRRLRVPPQVPHRGASPSLRTPEPSPTGQRTPTPPAPPAALRGTPAPGDAPASGRKQICSNSTPTVSEASC